MNRIPETTRALAKERPFFTHVQPNSPWPLRAADGRTWAQVHADRKAAEQMEQAA